jgi:hypothetical protein
MLRKLIDLNLVLAIVKNMLDDTIMRVEKFITTSSQLIHLIYYCMIMYNGWIELRSPLLWNLVENGVLHFVDYLSSGRVCFIEPIMERTIKQVIFSLLAIV